MEKPSKIRIGLIGCGGIAGYHMNHLVAIPEAEVVALADTDVPRAEKLKARYPALAQCPVFKDHREMLSSVKMDAVEVMTPHTLHYAQVVDAHEGGLHVLVEKPMVCTVKHAKDLARRVEQKPRVLLVSYQRHYQPQFRFMKNVIQEGQLGSVEFISALQCQQWLEGTKSTWRQDPALSGGGQLNDSGSHLLDIILWTTGLQASEVFAYIDNHGTQVDIDTALSVRFSNGAECNISVVGNSPIWWEDITIWGSKGILLYRNGRLQHYTSGGEAILEPLKMPPGSDPDVNFVNAILGKEPNESPATCGLRVIELTEAAWKSAKKRKPIRIK